MVRKFPPKGYRADEYPLPHFFSHSFSLEAEDETKNSTILTLFRQTEACNAPETVEVNPTNDNFAQDGGTAIHRGSIVPKLSLKMTVNMTKVAIETDGMRAIEFNWMPIYIAFLDNLDAEDEKTGTDIEDILELQHSTDNKDVFPLHTGVNLTSGGLSPMSTVGYTEVFGDFGFTTDTVIESVAFDKKAFFNNLQFKTNASMLRKVTGSMKSVTITRDRPYKYYSNRFTYPSVKRGNPYTYCGILFHLPQASDPEQYFQVTETTAIPHVDVNVLVRFDEWNNAFEQAPI